MTIISNNSTTKMSNLAIRVIRKSVLSLMDIALTLTWTSANMVGQIAGGNYAHMREEVSRKKMIKSSKVTENAGLIMVNEHNNLHKYKDK
jgi:tRNA A37 threonylcarbamoyladenosine synthetase subunit TsaC/SUA5/YrdC